MLFLLVFASCESTKRTTKTPTKTNSSTPSTPKDGGIVVIDPDKVNTDTVKVEIVEVPTVIDLDLPAGPDGAIVSVMMPFLSDQFYDSSASLPKNSNWGIAYYAGIKLGLEQLEKQGQKAIVHVFDTKADAGESQRLIADPELQESHALIAPYLTKNVRAAATPAKASGIPFVVPFSAASRLADAYPKMLQMQPGLLTHLDGHGCVPA